MLLEHLMVGALGTNCYIVACPETMEAAVIDPGGSAQSIIATIVQKQFKVKYIINTHGHYDHIGANKAVKEHTHAQLLIHEIDAPSLTNPAFNLSSYSSEKIDGPPADKLLKEGDIIKVGNTVELKVIHTPGHTPGGISLVTDGRVFAGDTLFAGSVGRTDFPNGSMRDLITGIKKKLLPLADSVIVYPGHGPSTTIGDERRSNPFLV